MSSNSSFGIEYVRLGSDKGTRTLALMSLSPMKWLLTTKKLTLKAMKWQEEHVKNATTIVTARLDRSVVCLALFTTYRISKCFTAFLCLCWDSCLLGFVKLVANFLALVRKVAKCRRKWQRKPHINNAVVTVTVRRALCAVCGAHSTCLLSEWVDRRVLPLFIVFLQILYRHSKTFQYQSASWPSPGWFHQCSGTK